MSRIRTGVTRLVQGVGNFQKAVFGSKESLFKKLGDGQSPGVLFITCSDSRINPHLLTQSDPGDLFILRNAGNIVPTHGSSPSGAAATIEYAVVNLKVRDVVLCGHSKCGAVAGILNPAALEGMPAVSAWLQHAAGIREEVEKVGASLAPEERFNLAIECNVLRQVEHLRTHPAVDKALKLGKIRIHSWVYDFESGSVVAYDAATGKFIPIADAYHVNMKIPTGKLSSEKSERI